MAPPRRKAAIAKVPVSKEAKLTEDNKKLKEEIKKQKANIVSLRQKALQAGAERERQIQALKREHARERNRFHTDLVEMQRVMDTHTQEWRSKQEMELRWNAERQGYQREKQTFKAKISVLERTLKNKVAEEVDKKYKNQMAASREQLQFYRGKVLELAKQLQIETEQGDDEEADPAIMPWRKCEKCEAVFEEQGKRVPRVLACGHTLCDGCVSSVKKAKKITCPFDHTEHPVTELPVNKLVLHM
ncbi:unnamed protein product [Caenorhabditis sp. 36 PRJEB53466]|nr:unnamed protein product [Caenorhabditis sp. 36 PRJEB53466]